MLVASLLRVFSWTNLENFITGDIRKVYLFLICLQFMKSYVSRRHILCMFGHISFSGLDSHTVRRRMWEGINTIWLETDRSYLPRWMCCNTISIPQPLPLTILSRDAIKCVGNCPSSTELLSNRFVFIPNQICHLCWITSWSHTAVCLQLEMGLQYCLNAAAFSYCRSSLRCWLCQLALLAHCVNYLYPKI